MAQVFLWRPHAVKTRNDYAEKESSSSVSSRHAGPKLASKIRRPQHPMLRSSTQVPNAQRSC